MALTVACAGEDDHKAAPLQRLDPPAGPGAMAPNLTAAAGGALLTWLEPVEAEDRQFRLLLARLGEAGWTAPREIAAGGDFFANWADLPAAAEDRDGALVAHWLDKLGDDTYAYGVELARSEDGGDTWRRLGLLHDDDSPTEHGFVSYAPGTEGLGLPGIHAFWLDGRGMVAGHGEGDGAGGHGKEGGAMGLRTALLGSGAAPPSTLLDPRVCECCSTDAAMTSAGPIVVYRDRSEDEVRDVAVVRATVGGWSAPRTIHDDGWQIHGCPVNGPAVAAGGERVAVAWFTAPGGEPRVLLALSADAGASFGTPVVIDGERPLGRVDVVLDDGGGALVSWLGSVGDEAEIRLRRVSPAGEPGPVRRIAATTQKRSAGVPRMVRDSERLVFVWVEDAKPSRLRANLLPLG